MARGDSTEEKILKAAINLFHEFGYNGTSVQDIVSAARVPKGSFYNYFASKEELGAAAIRHYSACTAAKLADALEGTPNPLAGLRTFFERLIDDFERAGFTGGCLVANLAGELDGSPACGAALAAAFRDWRDGVSDALQAAQLRGLIRDDVDATELADMLLEAWEGAVIRMKIDRSAVPLRRCLDRLLDGYFRP